jgi:hypothetical protein
MSKFKIGFAIAAIALMATPSMAEAQNFTQRGTRNGAIAGAIIGGIIGDQRNNAFTGAVIGGLVGGAAGRAVGRSKDARYYGGGQHYSYGNLQPYQSHYRGGGFRNSNIIYSAPINGNFGGHYYRNNFNRGGYYGHRNIGW